MVVTTINPSGTAEELVHQLSDSRPKLIFCPTDLVEAIERVAHTAKLEDVKIVALKTTANESYPTKCIHFDELIKTDGVIKHLSSLQPLISPMK